MADASQAANGRPPESVFAAQAAAPLAAAPEQALKAEISEAASEPELLFAPDFIISQVLTYFSTRSACMCRSCTPIVMFSCPWAFKPPCLGGIAPSSQGCPVSSTRILCSKAEFQLSITWLQVEQFTNALQRQSVREEEAGDEDVPGLPEAAEDLADEMAVAALSRTISMREDSPNGYS